MVRSGILGSEYIVGVSVGGSTLFPSSDVSPVSGCPFPSGSPVIGSFPPTIGPGMLGLSGLPAMGEEGGIDMFASNEI